MKVGVRRAGNEVAYRVEVEADDRTEAERAFSDVTARGSFRLSQAEYVMRSTVPLDRFHPDLHAAAILHVVRPFVGRTLTLSFAVSASFAEQVRSSLHVDVQPVDSSLEPFAAPAEARPVLLFSGGLDSVAAATVLPRDTPIVMLDRIVYGDWRGTDKLVDMVHGRAMRELLARDGFVTHVVHDGHEHLFAPYPTWHSEMSRLALYYAASGLGVSAVETGDVLDVFAFRGYQGQTAAAWGFSTRFLGLHDDRGEADAGPDGSRDDRQTIRYATRLDDRAFGFVQGACVKGLSEVATSKLVHHGPYRGRTSSCYYQSPLPFCLHCDKCFKKLLLHYVLDDQEVPTSLFEHFISQPHLARIFTLPYVDWHHVWFYIFQRVRCAHPFVAALQRQAQAGPDLSMLEKWYPRVAAMLPETYGAEVVANLERRLGAMTDAEVQALEALSLPPLVAPQPDATRTVVPTTQAADAPSPAPAAPGPDELDRMLDAIRRRLGAGDPAPRRFGAYSLHDVTRDEQRQGVGIGLRPVRESTAATAAGDAEPMAFWVCRRDPGAPAWIALGTYALNHADDTVVTSATQREAVAQLIVALTDGQVDPRRALRLVERS